MRLNHFTSRYHVARILEDGFLDVTESNIGSGRPDWPPYGEHVGPDVVWLTSKQTGSGCGLAFPDVPVDKTAVRITVDVPDDEVQPWSRWCEEQGIHGRWRRALEKGNYPETWFIIERRVLSDEWVAIEDARSGASLAIAVPA